MKHVLEDEIDKIYSYLLNASLYDERKHITDHFSYEWVDPITTRGNLTINYMINTTTMNIDVEPTGMITHFTARIEEDDYWKCEYHGPHLPLNTK